MNASKTPLKQSLLALKGLKHTGRPLTWDETNLLIDQILELGKRRIGEEFDHGMADIRAQIEAFPIKTRTDPEG